MVYDVIIIGLGPAGIAASIYAKRSGLNVLVLESSAPGGLLNYTNVINNYPGFINISGPELSMKMYEHYKSFDIETKMENVIDIVNGDVKKVITNNGEYSSLNVIIACGRSRRSLNLEGEAELMGKGISYCALCDAHFFKGRDVAVIGAGDSALEEALYLAKVVNKVKMIVKTPMLTGNSELTEKVNNTPNIEIMFNKTVSSLINKDGRLGGIVLNDGETLDVEGMFVYIGFDPVLPFKTDIGLKKEKGYLVVNQDFETNIEGIYAVGDIISKQMYQIISAEYEGASAASAIARKLTNKN